MSTYNRADAVSHPTLPYAGGRVVGSGVVVEVRGESSNRNSAPGWSAGGAILKMVGGDGFEPPTLSV